MADTRFAFADLSQEEMLLLVRDIRDSKRNGRRAEKLVPYAKEIYANILALIGRNLKRRLNK